MNPAEQTPASEETRIGYGSTNYRTIAPLVMSMIEKNRTDEVRALLINYGATKVSEVKLKHAEGFLAELKILEARK